MECVAVVNYLFKYCLYCASTVVSLICMKELTCNLVLYLWYLANLSLIAEVIIDLAKGDK